MRLAARALRRRPALAAVAAATLGLGIGPATAIFSIVDTILLRPLPYVEIERLATVWNTYDVWREHEIFGAYWSRIPLAWPDTSRGATVRGPSRMSLSMAPPR